jgi:hypothetical protein
MSEERLMILQMLQSGTISVEEAAKLLDAVPISPDEPIAQTTSVLPKQVTVLVTEGEKQKVNVRIPFSLVRASLKMGQSVGVFSARYIKEGMGADVAGTLNRIDMDELLHEIKSGVITLPHKLVDASDGDSHVLVTIE